MPTVQEIVRKTTDYFADRGIESARLDSELLIASALGWERLQVFLKFDYPLADDELERCRELVRRRAKGEPMAYILGAKGFYKYTFKISSSVLIPRPETELLVEAAVSHAGSKILDLGCGSGCIGLSILKDWRGEARAGATLDLVDQSQAALDVARENADCLDLRDYCRFICADAGRGDFGGDPYDVVVANPPYIDPIDPKIEKGVREFEPSSALFAGQPGDGGVAEISRWARTAFQVLDRKGIALFEIGDGQGNWAISTFREVGFSKVHLARDLSGRERMIVATKERTDG